MKKSFLYILFLSLFAVAACQSNDPSTKLIGCWKSSKVNAVTQQPDAFELTKTNLILRDGTPVGIVYEQVNNQINVINAAHKNTILAVTEISDANAVFAKDGSANDTYVRISKSELEAIRNTPAKLESKPDPF